MARTVPILLLLFLLALAGCERAEERAAAPAPAAEAQPPAPPADEASPAGEEAAPDPPAPPVSEDFEGEPRLSLFARLGAFRPAPEDAEGLSFWRTYLDHLLRTSGPAPGAGRDGGVAWALRSISGLDSVGFFSPLAVAPDTTYQVSFAFRGALPEGGAAGVGVIEFDRFLWIGEQFTEALSREHRTALREGLRLTGSDDWETHRFTFTTAPESAMIHLVLYREGEEARQPVFFDDIRIEPLPSH